MHLSTKTRYGVRAVFDIAYHAAPDGSAAQAKEVAKRQRIPLRYLEQIFQDLKKAGLVEAKRGPRGGYTLRRDPADIRLGDIVRALQGPIEAMIAAGDEPPRARGARGPVFDLWQDLAQHVSAWFDRVTVIELVRRAEVQGIPRAGAPSPMYFI